MASSSDAGGGKQRAGRADRTDGAAVLEEDVYAKQERLFAAESPDAPA
jgi:hypothetical protein